MDKSGEGQNLDFIGRKRPSDSPYIYWVWTGIAQRTGTQTIYADGNLDMAIIKRGAITKFLLSGPTTKAHTVSYEAGDEIVGIRFERGVHLSDLPTDSIVDQDIFLPTVGKCAFNFHGTFLSFPSFDTVESFIDKLAKLKMIQRDIVVEDTMSGRPPRIDIRTVQRHFLRATGMSPHYILQIQRAEQALALLQHDPSLSRVAHDTGFSDQAHMTRSFKYLLGNTPGRLRDIKSDW